MLYGDDIMEQYVVGNAKVTAKGQITLPKNIRDRLKVTTGDRITLICENDRVVLMNSAVYAMQIMQKGMVGEFGQAGIKNADDIMDLVKE